MQSFLPCPVRRASYQCGNKWVEARLSSDSAGALAHRVGFSAFSDLMASKKPRQNQPGLPWFEGAAAFLALSHEGGMGYPSRGISFLHVTWVPLGNQRLWVHTDLFLVYV